MDNKVKSGRRAAAINMAKKPRIQLERDYLALQSYNERLRSALRRLVMAREELEAHGETPVYQALKRGAWDEARAALGDE